MLFVSCCLILALTPTRSRAGEFDWLAGTYEVAFYPIRIEGINGGCSLVFKAVVADYIYSQGKPILLNGNVTFSFFEKQGKFALSLKLGILDQPVEPPYQSLSPLDPPVFAYIKSEHGDTSQIEHLALPSDTKGYANFAWYDPGVGRIVADIATGGPITIGFNRSSGGMDILLPLDLTVKSVYLEQGEVKRIHSGESIDQFYSCFREVLARMKR